ncbi:hypothetical protein BaRGS_00021268 [Batillaria attramentaria]|uniref:Uncharacterized protein n=1 Tax=Batillaria attramentaria TaxID=370345 RepID=A0ABD0KKQ9_9CAEN
MELNHITFVKDALPNPGAFRPVAETTLGQFGVLAATPEVILANGWFNNVTAILGITKDEGGLGLEGLAYLDISATSKMVDAAERPQIRVWLDEIARLREGGEKSVYKRDFIYQLANLDLKDFSDVNFRCSHRVCALDRATSFGVMYFGSTDFMTVNLASCDEDAVIDAVEDPQPSMKHRLEGPCLCVEIRISGQNTSRLGQGAHNGSAIVLASFYANENETSVNKSSDSSEKDDSSVDVAYLKARIRQPVKRRPVAITPLPTALGLEGEAYQNEVFFGDGRRSQPSSATHTARKPVPMTTFRGNQSASRRTNLVTSGLAPTEMYTVDMNRPSADDLKVVSGNTNLSSSLECLELDGFSEFSDDDFFFDDFDDFYPTESFI